MSNLFPVFIDITNKKCVVVGGGFVAERKIKTLLKYGAKVTVVSPNITEKINKLYLEGKITYLKKHYEKKDIRDAFLVVAATSSRQTNAQILRDAKFLVNVVEKISLNSQAKNVQYTVPAIFEKANLKMAISTEFPALSRLIKDELNHFFGKDFASYVRYLNKIRNQVKQKINDSRHRQRIFRKIASKKIVSIVRQYGFKKAKKEIERIINEI